MKINQVTKKITSEAETEQIIPAITSVICHTLFSSTVAVQRTK